MDFLAIWEIGWHIFAYLPSQVEHFVGSSGGSRGGAGAMPPVGGLKIFFRQYINIITKPTAYDGPWEGGCL